MKQQIEFLFEAPTSPVIPTWQHAAMYVGAVSKTGEPSSYAFKVWRRDWDVPGGPNRFFIEHLDQGLAREKASMEEMPRGQQPVLITKDDPVVQFLDNNLVKVKRGAVLKRDLRSRLAEWLRERGIEIPDTPRVIDRKLRYAIGKRFNGRHSGSVPTGSGRVGTGYRGVAWKGSEDVNHE